MVDVLSTRLQEVYAKWEARTDVPRETDESFSRLSLDGLRRAGTQSQRKRLQIREQARKIRANSLIKIKETELLVPTISRTTTISYQCCTTCTPGSRDSFASIAAKQLQSSGRNMLLVDPGPSLFSKIFKHFSFVYNIKKFDYPRVTQTVLNDERLKEAIHLTAAKSIEEDGVSEREALREAESRAKQILKLMESTMSDTLLRITAWVMYTLLPFFIKSLVVQQSQIEMLQKADRTGVPLVIVPLHRSHLDYIIVSLFTFTNNIKSCLIAAGDNLRIPLFGRVLNGLGAYYIKRRIDPVLGKKDILYRATLQTYVMESLRAGHNLEFFIEGGRTRTGKPCLPKAGILSIIVEAYLDGTIEDALVVPASVNYERLADGNFIREQLGQPKKMETFGNAIRAIWSTIRGNYGIVKVNICEPFSLKEMVRSIDLQLAKQGGSSGKHGEKVLRSTMSTSSLFGTDVMDDEHRQLVESLGRHVVYDGANATPIMSTNLVSFILLNKYREGCTMDELVDVFNSLRQELEAANKDLAFCGENLDIINHALTILGPGLVKQQRQEVTRKMEGQGTRKEFVTAITPVSILPNVVELAYYSNGVICHYVMDSIVVSALYATLKTEINDPRAIAENDLTVFHNSLMEKALKLCDILKYEFIFCQPCQDLEATIASAIQGLTHSGIIRPCEEGLLEEEQWSRRFAKTFDDSSDEEAALVHASRKIKYKLNLEAESSRRMEFLHTVLRPLIDTYTFSAFTLRKIVGRSLTERDLVQEIFAEIKTNLDRGIVNYGESLSVDTIRNAVKTFEKWNVLECHPQEKTKIYYLRDDYDNDAATNEVFETIDTFKWTRNIN
ncbi:glycerol-3-phosphate acyltransferase 1, mitochondrial isoform X3 [Diachasma alloeum]|nr:glycerol-3-phosphate acyltransferase 1, mitochondrial isoform X3 [Diachasma alloeum]